MELKYKKEAKLIKRLGVTVHIGGVFAPHPASDFCVGSGEGKDKVLGYCRVGVSWWRYSIQWA